jgi:Flp pilus assembly protein TadD
VDGGLRGYKGRHLLAAVYHEQGRVEEAEAQWREVTQERPDFVPGWLGLGQAVLARGDGAALEEVARRLEARPDTALEAALLRVRGLLSQRAFAEALALADRLAAEHPTEVRPRVLRSHVLLQEGRDLAGAEQALRDVLALDPSHREAQHNLAVLARQRAAVDAVFGEAGGGAADLPE